jgi:3-hydroxy-9,10-secoandrosta-1,3,5(10)-triene-9,17-dione monooxygenase
MWPDPPATTNGAQAHDYVMDAGIADIVQRVLPGVSARAETVDTTSEMPAQMLAELVEAGVFRLLQPKWCGGLEVTPMQFCDLVRAIAAVCGSTGWLTSVLGVGAWHVALFDERAQRDVWSDDPDALICSSYAPTGRLVAVDGGYELTGHWRFSSGSAHSSWALLGAMVVAKNAQPVDVVTVLVPRDNYRLENVWDAVGLRGTGSNDVHVERAFVPDYRTLPYNAGLRRGPGQKLNTGPVYRMPYGTMYSFALSAPLIGVAQGCLEAFLAQMRDRSRLSYGVASLTADQFAHVAIARAGSEVDAAALQIDQNLRDSYERARRREDISTELRLRARRDQVCATERAVKAVDAVFQTAKGMSLHRGNPIERAWRDAHTGSAHAGNDPVFALAMYGRNAFGLPVDDMLV